MVTAMVLKNAKHRAMLNISPQASGGVLRTKHETYAAAERMIGTLGDRWSEFLPPSAFRRALRKPQPAERDYLAAYVRCHVFAFPVHMHDEASWRDPHSPAIRTLPALLLLALLVAVRLAHACPEVYDLVR